MERTFIIKIPEYLTAFSLCESGKTIDYHSSEELSLSNGDILMGYVEDEPAAFKYVFKVLSSDEDSLRLEKTLETIPGYVLPIGSDLLGTISASNSRIIEIPSKTARDIKSKMVDTAQGRNQLSELSDGESAFIKYITAMRTKPFLLLAGISGTGKSRIVRQLASSVWPLESAEHTAQKPSNFEMVQVKPNWHDSSELIGYVSRIGDKPKFIAGDFLRFIAKAWMNPDIPYFLCLDEMNLAPVEQYFAEYLSVIESRKCLDNGDIVSDPILKKDSEEWYLLLCNELTADEEGDTIRNQFLKEGIAIPPNLIVVGTVNMDETTYSFSRKVLDRAMTIEMNEVDLKGGLHKTSNVMPFIPADHFLADSVEGYDVYEANTEVCDTVIAYLEKVNDILEGTPFKIAYRTRNEFLIYVVNALKLAEAEEDESKTIAQALDEVTSMKILSRIEGDKRKVHFLETLRSTIDNGLKDISEGFKSEVSIPKLNSMNDRLVSGYTSFWD